MNIIDEILSREEFINKPPVLIDIGASKEINKKWKKLAQYSICIAFDADDRDMGYIETESTSFKKLYVYNRIVVDDEKEETEFYLTSFPYCSSILQPDTEKLNDWVFAYMFNVDKQQKLKATNLTRVLKDLNIEYIDWFKTDSQGIDLRLFNSLDKNIINKVIVAEFEPGIIDAYLGEDKTYQLMQYMDSKPFWMAEMKVEGVQRISTATINQYFPSKKMSIVLSKLKKAPGWTEVTYFNTFKNIDTFDKREFLLGIAIGIIHKHYGFALEIATIAYNKFNDPFFNKLIKYTKKKIDILLFIQSIYSISRNILKKI